MADRNKERRPHVLDEQRQLAKQARNVENAKQDAGGLLAGLKNINRTATRRLDEAGVPDRLQGETDREGL